MKNMKKYEAPKVRVISRGEMDIICASELLFPIIPLAGVDENGNEIENV